MQRRTKKGGEGRGKEEKRVTGQQEGKQVIPWQCLEQHLEQGKDAPRASASVYSPSGGKPRAGLVSRLLSRLVSRLHPWLMLGRGIRLLRASVQHEGFQRRWTSLMKTEKLTKCQSHSINVITTLSWWLSTYPCYVSWQPCQKQEVWTKT